MALELFLNYERTSNSSKFFRDNSSLGSLSAQPYTLRIGELLSGMNIEQVTLSSLSSSYFGIYAFNTKLIDPTDATVTQAITANGVFSQTFSTVQDAVSTIALSSGEFMAPGFYNKYVHWVGLTALPVSYVTPTTFPTVCSVDVNLFSYLQTDSGIEVGAVEYFTLSTVYLSEFPTVSFIGYPSLAINESVNPPTATVLDSTNYTLSGKGLQFIGEGHTEKIFLSAATANCSDPELTWFVGNPSLRTLGFEDTDSDEPVYPTETTNLYKVSLPSVIGQERFVPVSVVLRSPALDVDGDFSPIQYKDNGSVEVYPFVSTTLVPLVDETTSTISFSTDETTSFDSYQQSIHIRTYPDPIRYEITNPFSGRELISLPFDFTDKDFSFKSSKTTSVSSIFVEEYINGTWNIVADTIYGDWAEQNIELADPGRTNTFSLKYDETYSAQRLEPYAASQIAETTVTVETTINTTSQLYISQLGSALNDWLPREFAQTETFTTTVLPQSLTVRAHTPNYFNLVDEDIKFELENVLSDSFTLNQVTLSSNASNEMFVYLPSEASSSSVGTLKANRLGKGDITLVITATDNTKLNAEADDFVVHFENVFEVLSEYDQIVDGVYSTSNTPLNISEKTAPLLSPNEWVTNDTINSILTRLYNTFDTIQKYTLRYGDRAPLQTWYSFQHASSDLLDTYAPVYRWMDLECYDDAKKDISAAANYQWFDFECRNPEDPKENKTRSWLSHEGAGNSKNKYNVPDPTCFQKYCLVWNWKARKASNSEYSVTWKDARVTGTYAKHWGYESCENDSGVLDCGKTNWVNRAFEPYRFPIPLSKTNEVCKLVGVVYLAKTDKIIVAHSTELRVLNNSYNTSYITRRGVFDEVFAIQDIAGIATNSDEQVFVLDRTLSQVAVLEYNGSNLELINTWGGYGTAPSSSGVRKPTDIHIDKNNFVWITDYGNKCVKKFNSSGVLMQTITNAEFSTNIPVSVCVDVDQNIHILAEGKVFVYDYSGNYSFSYELKEDVVGVQKIQVSYNKHIIYISYLNGVVKYFKNGIHHSYLIKDYVCQDEQVLQNYTALHHDVYRNLFVIAGNKVLKFGDVIQPIETKTTTADNRFYTLDEILIDKNEFVQPWIYTRAFHRLWDNIEIIRNSLYYETTGNCRRYLPPTYQKSEIVIGQNELVTNTVFNRLSRQIWANLSSVVSYFNKTC